MTRWAARAAIAIVVLIVLALAGMWMRSYWRVDVLSWVREEGSTCAIVSCNGAVHLIDAAGTRARPRPVTWDSYRLPTGATHASVHRDGELTWRWLGFAHVGATTRLRFVSLPAPTTPLAPATKPSPSWQASLPFAPIPPSGKQQQQPPPAALTVATGSGVIPLATVTPFGPTTERALLPWLSALPSQALIIPYWPLSAVAGVYAGLLVRRRLRSILRSRRGQCRDCGYDLRGSAASGRCPECGASMPVRSGVAIR